MGTFDKWNKQISAEEQKAIDEAKQNTGFSEVPKGTYIGKIEMMDIGTTKDGRPMFKVQVRLTEGSDDKAEEFLKKYKNKKPCVFMNRVIAGTKNDPNMIASVLGWLDKFVPDEPVRFTGNYDELKDDILDLAEELQDVEFKFKYDTEAFNSITVTDVFE